MVGNLSKSDRPKVNILTFSKFKRVRGGVSSEFPPSLKEAGEGYFLCS